MFEIGLAQTRCHVSSGLTPPTVGLLILANCRTCRRGRNRADPWAAPCDCCRPRRGAAVESTGTRRHCPLRSDKRLVVASKIYACQHRRVRVDAHGSVQGRGEKLFQQPCTEGVVQSRWCSRRDGGLQPNRTAARKAAARRGAPNACLTVIAARALRRVQWRAPSKRQYECLGGACMPVMRGHKNTLLWPLPGGAGWPCAVSARKSLGEDQDKCSSTGLGREVWTKGRYTPCDVCSAQPTALRRKRATLRVRGISADRATDAAARMPRVREHRTEQRVVAGL